MVALAGVAGCGTAGGAERGGFRLEPTTAAELRDRVGSGAARATLVNVWSTWCDPCVEEMPELLALREAHHKRGFELMLVSADFESNRADVEAFLTSHAVTFPTYVKAEPDQEFITGLHEAWSGTLPLTLLYDRRGQLVQSWQGRIDFPTVDGAVRAVLDEHP